MAMLYSVSSQVMQDMSNAERDRLQTFAKRWGYYDGSGWPSPLKPTKTDPAGEDNILLNFAELIVDKGVSMLFGSNIAFELPDATPEAPESADVPEEPAEEDPAEAWLDSVWAYNRKMSTLLKLGTNGGVYGHGFVKIQPQPAPNLPRIIVLDSCTVTPTCDPEDIENVIAWTIQWNTTVTNECGQTQPAVRRQVIEQTPNKQRWQISDLIARGDSLQWQPLGPSIIWPYPFSPIVDCQNLPAPNEFWGKSDLEESVIRPNKAANQVLSNAQRILRHFADPLIWGTGFGDRPLEREIGKILKLPSTDSRLSILEMQSDLDSSQQVFKILKELTFTNARVPEIATGKVENVGQLSGLALKVLYGPLVEKTETKRITYGDLLVELNRRLLAIGGFGDQRVCTITWPEIVPSSPLEERQVALIDHQLGVSNETLLGKLGYDAEDELSKANAGNQALGEQLLTNFANGGQGGMGQ